MSMAPFLNSFGDGISPWEPINCKPPPITTSDIATCVCKVKSLPPTLYILTAFLSRTAIPKLSNRCKRKLLITRKSQMASRVAVTTGVYFARAGRVLEAVKGVMVRVFLQVIVACKGFH